jgi:Rrf2 family protein
MERGHRSLQEFRNTCFMVNTTGHFESSFPMQITRATDYAVRVLIHLAALPEGQKMQLNTLAELTGVRGTFLSKILQRLVHRGLVTSYRGTGGGFCLKASPANVTLLQVIESIEGPTRLNVCLREGDSCTRKSWCGVHPVWKEAQSALTGVLGGVSIAELAEETVANLGRANGQGAAESHP